MSGSRSHGSEILCPSQALGTVRTEPSAAASSLFNESFQNFCFHQVSVVLPLDISSCILGVIYHRTARVAHVPRPVDPDQDFEPTGSSVLGSMGQDALGFSIQSCYGGIWFWTFGHAGRRGDCIGVRLYWTLGIQLREYSRLTCSRANAAFLSDIISAPVGYLKSRQDYCFTVFGDVPSMSADNKSEQQ